MKLQEKFLTTIFKAAAQKPLNHFNACSPEIVLKLSGNIIDEKTDGEIKSYIISQQTAEGGFSDRAGRCDIYYSLFGCFLSEAFGLTNQMAHLGDYIKRVVSRTDIVGVDLYCAAIIHSKLFGAASLPSSFYKRINSTLPSLHKNQVYSDFVSLLTFFYCKDYYGLYEARKEIKHLERSAGTPCPVTAASLVLGSCYGKTTKAEEEKLRSFYLNNGSFAAVRNAPVGDLLSTAVALYAMKFANTDMRLIKPDCMTYVDSLYSHGGFCATVADTDCDIEYTFYGLLALGALSE